MQDIFDLFVQFDDLQNTIQEDRNFSKKKYNNIFKKLEKIDLFKDITKDKLDLLMKQYPIKKSDVIDIIDTILSQDNISSNTAYNRVRNFIESDIDTVYKTALEYPSYYDDIIDFTNKYFSKKIDHRYGQFQTDLDEYIQRDINSTSG